MYIHSISIEQVEIQDLSKSWDPDYEIIVILEFMMFTTWILIYDRCDSLDPRSQVPVSRFSGPKSRRIRISARAEFQILRF